MYKELCFYTDVILLGQASGKSELYHLPVFHETAKFFIRDKQNKASKESVILDANIFQVRDSLKRHIISSLDL